MKILEYIALLRNESKQRTLNEYEQSIIDIWHRNVHLEIDNKRLKNENLIYFIERVIEIYPETSKCLANNWQSILKGE